MSELVVLPVGATFAGDFVVEGLLGSGGMGAVHRALQLSTEKRRALKVMRPELVADIDLRRRFVQEARVGARIESDHVVEVLAAGVDDPSRLPFLVMELLDGVDLGAHINARGPLPLQEIREILEQVYHAIGAAHAVGVVHRDIKPENIFLARSRRAGSPLSVKLLDFGIAKIVAEAESAASSSAGTAALGTPLWMAPEQTRQGPITPGADVWSLGLLVFYMLTGRSFWREAATGGMSFASLVRELLIEALPTATARATELGRGHFVPPGFDAWFARGVVRGVTARFSEGAGQWAELSRVLGPSVPHAASIPARRTPSELASPFSTTAPEVRTGPELAPSSAASALSREAQLVRSVASRAASLPAPLAPLANRLEGAAPGLAQRCGLVEIAGGVVRYASAVALARLTSDPSWRPSEAVAASIGSAARWSESAWCELARSLQVDLEKHDPVFARRLAFLTAARSADVARMEEELGSGRAQTVDLAANVLALLDGAASLFAPELRVVRPTGNASAAARASLMVGEAMLCVEPWLPRVEDRIGLPDAPHAAGEPWRIYDAERGEHRHAPALDAALRGLLGAATQGPPPMNHAPPLVGRDAVLAVLRRNAAEAVRGAVRVVVLSGPLGIGRTRLSRSVRDEAASLGFSEVIDTSCSRERRSPLRALSGAFGGGAAFERVAEAVRIATAEARTSTAESFDALVESVEEELLDASLASSALVIIDELQWADEATLLLLSLLTERASMGGRGKLLVVAALRTEPSPPARLTSLLGQIEREAGPAVSRIELPTLSDPAARLLVRGVAKVTSDVEEHVVRGAGGLPSLLVQPLLTWSESGALVWSGESWTAASAALWSQSPPGMSDLVRARLSSYFGARTPARHAAEVVLALVGAAGKLSADRLTRTLARIDVALPLVETALETLVDASLLEVAIGGTEYAYRQPILQRATVEILEGRPWFGRVLRAYLDAVAGERAGGASSALLANGYQTLGLYDEARAWLEHAATYALESGLFEDAVTFAERLRALASTAATAGVAGLLASEALLRAGRGADAVRRYGEIEWHGADAALLVRGRTLEVHLLTATGGHADGIGGALIAEADALGDEARAIEARVAVAAARRGRPGLALLETAEDQLAKLPHDGAGADVRYRARSLRLELLYEVRAPQEEWRAVAALARIAARATGSVWAELDIDADLAVLEAEGGRPEAAVEILVDVAARARAARLGTVMRNALNNIAACQRLAGRTEAAADASATAVQAAREAGSWRHLAAALSIRATALTDLGALDVALAALDESIALQLRAGSTRVTTALMRRAEVRRRLGDDAGARADVRDVFERAERAGADSDAAKARAWLAVQDVRDGVDDARARLSALLERTGDLLATTADGRALVDAGRRLLIDSA